MFGHVTVLDPHAVSTGRAGGGRLATLVSLAAGLVILAAALLVGRESGGDSRSLAVALAALPLLVLLAAVARAKPWTILVAAAVSAILQPPSFLGFQVGVGSHALYFSDLLLPLAFAFALARRGRLHKAEFPAWALLAAIAAATAWGALRGNDFKALVQDARGPVYLVLSYLSLLRMWSPKVGRALQWAGALTLWATALAMLVQSATGVVLLSGRVQNVVQQKTAVSSARSFDVTRFLLNPRPLAMVVLVAATIAALSGSRTRGHGLWIVAALVPSFVICFLSYSRALLVGVGFALALSGLLALRSRFRPWRVVASVGALVLVAVPVPLGLSSSAVNNANGNFVARQVAAFNGRVIGGLSSSQVTSSSGNQWRLREAGYALTAVETSPLVGHGIGFAYRPDVIATGALQSFKSSPDYGTRFIHNSYLFLLVKLGLLGLGLAMAMLFTPVARALLGRRQLAPFDLGLAYGLLAPLMSALFFPEFATYSSCMVFGLVAAYLWVRLAGPDPQLPPAQQRSEALSH